MNNIISTKTTSSIFLGALLVLGTISTILPSFIVGAQAEPYYDGMDDRYDSYEPTEYPSKYTDNQYNTYETREYPSYQPDYKPEYPSDNNSYKSEKDSSSSSVSLNKLKCINNNVSINGNNTGNINVGNSGSSASSPGTYDEGYLGVGSSGGNYGEGYDNGYNKQKDAGFTCIINNNNNNTNIVAGGGNVTEPTATLAVTKTVTCNPNDNLPPAIAACQFIQTTILPSLFNIVVTGSEPDPDEFPGSSVPVVVTLGAGDYEVTEEVPTVIPPIAGVSVARTTTFAGECTDVEPLNAQSTVAAGTIEAGEPQTCNITNKYDTFSQPSLQGSLTASNLNTDTSAFDINTAGGQATSNTNTVDIASSFSSPPTMAQGTEEASSSALEKVEKLKQQWLDLLP